MTPNNDNTATSCSLHDLVQECLSPQNTPGVSDLIPTGILPLDHALGGGVRPGTFNIACALTGEGKSSLMIHLAQVAAQMGYPVLICHSEMSTDAEYFPRLARWQAGGSYHGIAPAEMFPMIKIQDIRSQRDRGLATILTDIQSIKTEHELTPLLIVDSMDRPGDDRQHLERFARDLTTLTESESIVTWATSQANNSESDTVAMEHLRESRGKAHPCSMFVGLRKRGDAAVLTIDKNRHGRQFQLRCRVDWAAQRFSDVNDTYQIPPTTCTQLTRQICMAADKSV